MIVVSEIGEQWSPHTAPAMQADTQMIASGDEPSSGNAFSVIGIRIPNVPQEVPVANERTHAIKKITAGKTLINEPFVESTTPATNSAAPRESVIAFRVHARVRIEIGATIALNPSSRQAMHSLNLRTLLTR
jgi:hypothetical protein